MRKEIKIILVVVIAATVLTASYYALFVRESTEKTFQAELHGNTEHYVLDPFNNTSGPIFTINLTVDNSVPGTISLEPTVILNSTYSPNDTQESSLLFNLSKENPLYGTEFTSKVYIYPTGDTPGSGNYAMYLYSNVVIGAAGPVLMWNNNGHWTVESSAIYLNRGTYNISDQINILSIQPSQELVKVANASSVINLVSFGLSYTTAYFGNFSISNITVRNY